MIEGLITNAQLIENFEKDIDPSAPFHHADHVRLAFAYLCEFPMLEALARFSAALKQYAAARGKTQLYHETITWAYFFLIRERMGHGEMSWEEFANSNSELLRWKSGVLERYYTAAKLQSDVARKVFVMPDRLER